ncbi:2-polyprenylphenol 6-hydroxylase [Oceaniradius stylonematis]|jgi:ubiquinone biosynthesis protein|uniref:2-polyprenylphenol 6-hydroxylase n=1 Tax=Oceaniradius stylonematis TaxID=2184161 RepID=UPI000F4148A6|nr:MAG: 2-polyprenylphenol 6-hydroxylase [Oricola sp.]
MTSLFAAMRLLRAVWVLAREGVIAALPRQGLSGPALTGHKIATRLARKRSEGLDSAQRMTKAIARLGPSYAKLGQFLATRPDIIGLQMAVDLATLQDNMESFPSAQAHARIEESLGLPVDDLYARLDEPIAAASIAQVHPGITRAADGSERRVAVKVIRPGVRSRFDRDLEAFFLFARMQERYIPSTRRLRPVAIAETLAQSTRIEMDLRLEGAALSELAENTKDDPGFRVPKVDWQRTGRDVLTMEWIDGIKMSDVDALKAAGHDLPRLAVNVIQSFLRHAVRDGFFHADMHPGNLFVDTNGDIVAVDLGIAGRIGIKERRFLAEILYGFIRRDYRRVAEVHFEAGYVPPHHDIEAFAQALRAVGEPIRDQSADTISMGNLLTLLFDVTDIFDMQTRPELLLLQKTMVVVEGNARVLDPHFDMWAAAEPIVSDWVRRNLGPAALVNDARDGVHSAIRIARQLPELADRTERLSRDIGAMAEHGLKLAPETVARIGKAEARESRWGRVALWVIALAAIWIAIAVS